ncbi:MAG: hypothetical protein M1820_009194 [Bogoriella megaspora]|nr:MAG: hypothetical protein M1820_009194 [Bogoriella megaspora]
MASQQYEPDFLRFLRQSPLVKKPDGLPSIEQWMDGGSTVDPAQRRARALGNRSDDLLLQNEKQSQRPSLMQTRTSTRVSSGAAGDTFLGPPKTAFASASRIANKTSDPPSRTTPNHDDDVSTTNKSESHSRFFGEKAGERQTDKNGHTNGRRTGREDNEGWTNLRNRKGSSGQEDADRAPRGEWNRDRVSVGRGEREKQGADLERRPGRIGAGRGRHESGSWRSPPPSAGVDGEWEMPSRNGISDRDRRLPRDSRTEREPEWMDEPVSAIDKSEGKPKTAEDFQRWKAQMDQMKANKEVPDRKLEEEARSSLISKDAGDSQKSATALKFDADFGNLSSWGMSKPTDIAGDMAGVSLKSMNPKPKSSKFKGFFAPKEEPAAPTAPSAAQASALSEIGASDEDKAGFNRILQALNAGNAYKHSDSQENNPSRDPLTLPTGNNSLPIVDESLKETIKTHEERSDTLPPESSLWPPLNQRQGLGPAAPLRLESNSRSPQNEALFQDLSTLTNPRNQTGDQQPNAKRDLLLSLMGHAPTAATTQQVPRPPSHQPPDDPEFQIFLNNEPPQQPAPRRGPNSGFFDERFVNDFDRQQQQQQQNQSDFGRDLLGRRPSQSQSQRAPRNILDDPAISEFQRHNPMSEQEQRFQGNPIGFGSNPPIFDGAFPGGNIPPPPQHQFQHSAQQGPQGPQQQQRHDPGPPPGFSMASFRNHQQQPQMPQPPLSSGFPPGFNPNQGNFSMNRNLPPMDGHPSLNRQISQPPGPGGPGGPSGPPPHNLFPGGPPPGFFNGPPNGPPPGFPGFPPGMQGFGPDGGSLGRGVGGNGQQGMARGQAFDMNGRMFR